MKLFIFILSVFYCTIFPYSLHAQLQNEKESPAYKNSMRNMVPDKWYLSSSAMLRVTLKKGIGVKQISLDSVTLNRQLDTIIKQGYTSIQIYGTPHGGKSFEGLDVVDHYNIDPEAGSMDDFKRLVRQAHSKKIAVVAIDNLGYCSIDAPHFVKACEDINQGKISKETKWFSWADSSTAKQPMSPDSYYLGGSKYEKWVYSPIAKKYYWSKWDGVNKDGKPCSMPQYNWSHEWQEEVKNIVHFWMNTGIDGILQDAVSWYTNYTWQAGKECITDIISSYGNALMLPEGAGGFHEDPVPWITEGGWNCVIDYGLGIWWEMDRYKLFNAIEKNNPSELEEALRNFHDRVVADGGVLNIDDVGADTKLKYPAKYYLYVAFNIATGHLYCKMMHSQEDFTVNTTIAQILNLKNAHAAFGQLSKRQKLSTNDDNKYYAFIEKTNNNSEKIVCVFNFQASQQEISIDMSGINAASLIDLTNSQKIKYAKQMQFNLPAYGYRFYKILNEKF